MGYARNMHGEVMGHLQEVLEKISSVAYVYA